MSMTFPQITVGTKLTAKIPGLDLGPKDWGIHTFVSMEASAEMAAGVFVARSSTDLVKGIKKLAAVTDLIAGALIQSHTYSNPDQVGTTGIKPGVVGNVRRSGLTWMRVEEAVQPGDRVLVRCVASGAEIAGSLRKTVDASDCKDISDRAEYMSSTSGAGEVLLAYNLDGLAGVASGELIGPIVVPHLALTATQAYTAFWAPFPCYVERVAEANATGLAVDGTNNFKAVLTKTGGGVVATLFDTDDDGAALAAGGGEAVSYGTTGVRSLATGDHLLLTYTEEGTATLPEGSANIWIRRI